MKWGAVVRQHKFKAWDKKRKRMYEVLHLHFNKFEGNWATVKGYDIIAQKDIHIQIQPQDIELLEFTGLEDNNGTEIYEGDILSTIHENGIDEFIDTFKIVWDIDKAGFMVEYFNDEEYCNLEELPDCRVIGNIYEDGGFLANR